MAERGHDVVGVLTSPDRAPGSVAAAADELGLPVLDPGLVRDPEFARWIVGHRVDLLVNVHSLRIAHEDVVAAPRIGSFDLHPGPLPRYAGLNAPSWAIYEGETRHAVTLHRMSGTVDAGAIAYEAWFDIGPTDTGLRVATNCVRLGVPLVGRPRRHRRTLPRRAPGADVCCGVGNLARAIATHVPGARVWASDLTERVAWRRRRTTSTASVWAGGCPFTGATCSARSTAWPWPARSTSSWPPALHLQWPAHRRRPAPAGRPRAPRGVRRGPVRADHPPAADQGGAPGAARAGCAAVRVRAGPGEAGRAAVPARPGLPIGRFDERVDEVWRSAAGHYPVLARRDLVAVRWRIDQRPDAAALHRYYLVARHRTVGYVVLRTGGTAEAPTAVVVDYQAPPRWVAPLLLAASRVARWQGAVAVSVKTRNRQADRSLRTTGFLRRDHGSDDPIRTVVLRTDDDVRPLVTDPDRWFVTSADSDLEYAVTPVGATADGHDGPDSGRDIGHDPIPTPEAP